METDIFTPAYQLLFSAVIKYSKKQLQVGRICCGSRQSAQCGGEGVAEFMVVAERPGCLLTFWQIRIAFQLQPPLTVEEAEAQVSPQ